MDTQDTRRSAEHFLALIKASHRGKFKVYIGMSAGVGKTYRMLQEAHQLLDAGVDVQIGYIETHGRPETEALTEGPISSWSTNWRTPTSRAAQIPNGGRT